MIGLDTTDANLVERYMIEGTMPYLSRLKDRGFCWNDKSDFAIINLINLKIFKTKPGKCLATVQGA